MSVKDDLKKFATDELDIDFIGVTGVDRLAEAPKGHRPTDILPGAQSVVVMSVRLIEGAVQTIFRAHEDGLRHLQCVYGTHGYALTPNYHLKFAAYRLARFLEKRGFVATPLPSGPGGGGAPFSHRHAAVAAGLGEFGWSSIVVTPEAGPRARFVSVITTAELEPDPLYDGPRLCDPKKCGICMKVCPAGAISKTESKSVMMGGRSFEYGVVNFAKCRIGLEGLTKKTLGYKDLPIPENPTMADIEKAREGIDPRQISEAILPVNRTTWYCGKCLAYCPIGRKKKTRRSRADNPAAGKA
jgi:epoxyqueuosine reductase